MDRTLSKDFHCLLKSIDSFSDGQAVVLEWDDDNLSRFMIEIAPNDGLYKGGKFKFLFRIKPENWPTCSPEIHCMTPIFHPNIEYNYEEENFEAHNFVCVEGLEDDWVPTLNLDFCVLAVLFLFHHPNTDDPIGIGFGDEMTMSRYAENVMISLKGGYIDVPGYESTFEPNYGWVEKHGSMASLSAQIDQSPDCVDSCKNNVTEAASEISSNENTVLHEDKGKITFDSENDNTGANGSQELIKYDMSDCQNGEDGTTVASPSPGEELHVPTHDSAVSKLQESDCAPQKHINVDVVKEVGGGRPTLQRQLSRKDGHLCTADIVTSEQSDPLSTGNYSGLIRAEPS